MKLLMENWRKHLKESSRHGDLRPQLVKIMKLAANIKLMTGPRGARKIRPEWEEVFGALDAIAMNDGGPSILDGALYPAYKKSIQSRKNMSYDELDKLETTAEDQTTVELWKLSDRLAYELDSGSSSVPKELIDAFLNANAKIQQAGAQPAQGVGQFRDDKLGGPAE